MSHPGAHDLHRKFRHGELSAVEVTAQSLEYCTEDPYNAIITVNANATRSAVASAERYNHQASLGQWDGIPFVAKDNIAVANLPWTAGIEAYRHRVAAEDATLIQWLERQGAILVGKANLHEAALGTSTNNPWFGPCHHPHRHGYSPGGSSGGSAVAVAAGYVPLALGTDSMGSVRIPAAFCGIFGYKPGNGLVSGKGVTPLSTLLDTIGLIARTAKDLEIYGASLIAAETGVLSSVSEPPIVGTVAESALSGCTEDVIMQYQQAVDLLRQRGAILTETDWIDNPTRYRRAGLALCVEEAYREHQTAMTESPQAFSSELTGLLHFAKNMNSAKLADARATIEQLKSRVFSQWSDVDVVLTPATPCATHLFSDAAPVNLADYTAIANLTGIPATAIPYARCSSGLPLGLQLIGKTHQDKALLSHTTYVDRLLRAPGV